MFSNPKDRQQLNTITHPTMLNHSRTLFTAAGKTNPHTIIIYDMPLLVKTKHANKFNLVMIIHTTTKTHITHIVKLRKITHDKTLHHLNSQTTNTNKFSITDIMIDTDKSIDKTLAQTNAL